MTYAAMNLNINFSFQSTGLPVIQAVCNVTYALAFLCPELTYKSLGNLSYSLVKCGQ